MSQRVCDVRVGTRFTSEETNLHDNSWHMPVLPWHSLYCFPITLKFIIQLTMPGIRPYRRAFYQDTLQLSRIINAHFGGESVSSHQFVPADDRNLR